jgi:hypothetical protein
MRKIEFRTAGKRPPTHYCLEFIDSIREAKDRLNQLRKQHTQIVDFHAITKLCACAKMC